MLQDKAFAEPVQLVIFALLQPLHLQLILVQSEVIVLLVHLQLPLAPVEHIIQIKRSQLLLIVLAVTQDSIAQDLDKVQSQELVQEDIIAL